MSFCVSNQVRFCYVRVNELQRTLVYSSNHFCQHLRYTKPHDSWQCNSHVVTRDDPVQKCSHMIMWRSSKRLIINCLQFVIRCGRSNFDADDLDDISDYDVLDVPSNSDNCLCCRGELSPLLWEMHLFKNIQFNQWEELLFCRISKNN